MTKLLFAEDEADLALIIADNLKEEGYDVVHIPNGGQVLDAFRAHGPDLVILDVMLPEMDGFTLARHIRAADAHVPILFLTARTGTSDVVNAFEHGANDYLRKPFGLQELIVRVRELLKRSGLEITKGNDKIKIRGYELDTVRQQLLGHGHCLDLSYRETVLLQMLWEHKNQVLTRENIIHAVWPKDRFFTGRSLDVYVSRLRNYLKADTGIAIINVRAKGYKLMVNN